jgi:hypothetical protein
MILTLTWAAGWFSPFSRDSLAIVKTKGYRTILAVRSVALGPDQIFCFYEPVSIDDRQITSRGLRFIRPTGKRVPLINTEGTSNIRRLDLYRAKRYVCYDLGQQIRDQRLWFSITMGIWDSIVSAHHRIDSQGRFSPARSYSRRNGAEPSCPWWHTHQWAVAATRLWMRWIFDW